MDLQVAAERIKPQLVELRRELHQHPELGLKEEWTPARIRQELSELNIPWTDLDEGSLVGVVGTRGRRNIAIRADMDGLPVREETGLPFAATNGCMHACGHDGHVAMLLGAARVLKGSEQDLGGAVYLCFQTAEEIGRGAQPIVDHLNGIGGVDEAIAIHLWADIDSGSVSIKPGPCMSGADLVEIVVRGRGGHGSRPDLAIDPIKPSCAIVLGISAIPTNMVSTLEPAVVHVGQIHAGTASNVFPPDATISAGVRTFTPQVRAAVIEKISQVAEHAAAQWGATAEVTSGVASSPPVVNDTTAVKRAHRVVDTMAGRLENVEFEKILASENFSVFTEAFPGFMAHLGVRRPDVVQYYQHHPKFDIDEDVLPLGVEFFTRYAIDFVNDSAGREER